MIATEVIHRHAIVLAVKDLPARTGRKDTLSGYVVRTGIPVVHARTASLNGSHAFSVVARSNVTKVRILAIIHVLAYNPLVTT